MASKSCKSFHTVKYNITIYFLTHLALSLQIWSYDIIWQLWHCQLLHAFYLLSPQIRIKCGYNGLMSVHWLCSPVGSAFIADVYWLTPTSLSRLQRFCCCSNSWIVASCSLWPSPCFGLFTTRPAGNTTAGKKTHNAQNKIYIETVSILCNTVRQTVQNFLTLLLCYLLQILS